VKIEDGINHVDRMNESSSNDCTEGEGGEGDYSDDIFSFSPYITCKAKTLTSH
jgi:hypothetical protein